MRRVTAVIAGIILTIGLIGSPAVAHPRRSGPLGPFTHLVVIYQENHSFDNLYGGWGTVRGQRVEGRGSDGYARRSVQVREDGTPYRCLYQNDPSLSTPPLDAACGTDTATNGFTYASHFRNRPFEINDYITPESPTCPGATPGGCTRDLVHRFYQEQYQLDGGRMDRYSTGSDAAGLTQGYYDTRDLPIYEYLHTRGAPRYVIADHFFQAAFGGSFLNHQYLIAAQAPPWPDPAATLHSVIDAQGFPNPNLPNATGVRTYPLHSSNPALADQPLTQACPGRAGFACGDYAVNTVQPTNPPTAARPDTQPPPLPPVNDVNPAAPNYRRTIGDELSGRGVSWAWYAGGWNDAAAGHPGSLFQYHHQPFNYFARYAPDYVDPRTGEHPRDHLKDETAFYSAARTGALPAVSFVKPYGAENEHPGYASTENGERHLVDLIQAVQSGPQAEHTLIVVTYDEFGGQWDHVVPPGQGRHATPGPSDEYGPSTRIPALLISPSLRRSGVDHTSYDTTSILRTIEAQYGLAPLDTRFGRDARVNDLSHALRVGGIPHH
jgi:acid phosphatase